MVVANLAKDENMFSLHSYSDVDSAIHQVKQGKGVQILFLI
jgi:hypothetical protein